MVPRSWAASSPRAICLAIETASDRQMVCCAIRSGERHALDEFEDEHLYARGVFIETVSLRDVVVVERRQRLPSRTKRARRPASSSCTERRVFSATSPCRFVSRAP